MKKIIAIFLSVIMVGALASCKKIEHDTTSSDIETVSDTNTSSEETTVSDETTSSEETTPTTGGVEKTDTEVLVTVPANLVGDDQTGELTEDQIKQGFLASKVNTDGSIVYKLDPEKYDVYISTLKTNLKADLNEMAGSGEYESLVEVLFSGGLDEVTLLVNPEKYNEGTDNLLPKGLSLNLATYLVFSGTPMNELQVVINVEDSETNEVIDTVVYPAGE